MTPSGEEGPSYHDLAGWYDVIYDARGKDYDTEADTLLAAASEFGARLRSLLDVACGTGRHLAAFDRHVDEVVGLDRSPEMLAVAAGRVGPDVVLVEGDQRDFDLGRRFDVVTCLFSSIGYVADADELDVAIASIARHVAPGGVLLVEPFLTPELVEEGGRRDVLTAETAEGVIARVGSSRRDGDVLVVDFAWAVATPAGVSTTEERHRLALFTRERYLLAVERAGLEASWRDEVPGLIANRGLLIGRRKP